MSKFAPRFKDTFLNILETMDYIIYHETDFSHI